MYKISQEELKKEAFQYLGYNFKREDDFNKLRLKKVKYDREKVKMYIEKYAENPNIDYYPYFKKGDCANFVSQAINFGGMKELGTDWRSFNSWFCNTNTSRELKNISITWRAARYFRKHWGNEEGIGKNRAQGYAKIRLDKAMYYFYRIYQLLSIGDVIQYGDPLSNDYPYHTQIIQNKGYNISIGRRDLIIAQHTSNKKDISLYNYLKFLDKKNKRYIYIYKITYD